MDIRAQYEICMSSSDIYLLASTQERKLFAGNECMDFFKRDLQTLHLSPYSPFPHKVADRICGGLPV